jgi:O-antigen/teichoic acid export membrane protein
MSPLRRGRALLALPLARTSALLGINTLVAGGLGFLFWAIAARSLPAAEVGRASAYTAGIGLLVALAALGLPETLIRHLPHSRTPRLLVGRMASLSIAVGVLAGAAFLAVPAAGAVPLPLGLPIAIGITVALLLLGLANATLLAERRAPAIVAGSLATGVAKCAALLFAVNATGAVTAYGVGALVGVGVAATVAYRGLPRRAVGSDGVRLPLRGYALSNWAGGAASLLPLALAPSLLLERGGPEAAAYAAIPLLLLTFLTLPPAVVARTLFAEASRHPERTGHLARRGLVLAGAGSLCALAGAILFAPLVLSAFGTAYAAEGAPLLVLLAVASLVAVPNYFIDVVFNVRRDTTGFAVVNIAGSAAVAAALLLLARDPISLGVAWIVGQTGYLAIAVAALLYRRRFPHG